MQKQSIVLVLLAVLFIGVGIYWYERGDALLTQPTSDTTSVSTITSAVAVPEGWYSHELDGFEGIDTLLTKTPSTWTMIGEHIAIVDRDTTVTPEQYLKENLNLDESNIQFAIWGTHYGRKMFSVGFTNLNDGSKEQSIYLFGDSHVDPYSIGHVVMVNLYPDKQENRAAFQQVVNYYAQTLPMISRDETLAACKTINLPPGQEYDIQGDTETGYVTIGYWPGSGPGMSTQETYTFLNYNDDLSQCTSGVRELLSSMKIDVDKRNADQCIEMKAILSGKESLPTTTDEQHRQAYMSLAKEFVKNNCQ